VGLVCCTVSFAHFDLCLSHIRLRTSNADHARLSVLISQNSRACVDKPTGEDAFLHALGISLDAARREDTHGDGDGDDSMAAAGAVPRQSWRVHSQQDDYDETSSVLVGGGRGRGRGVPACDVAAAGEGWETVGGRGRGRGAVGVRGRGRGTGQRISHGHADYEVSAGGGIVHAGHGRQASGSGGLHSREEQGGLDQQLGVMQSADDEDDEELRMVMELSAKEAREQQTIDKLYREQEQLQAAAACMAAGAASAYHNQDSPDNWGSHTKTSNQGTTRRANAGVLLVDDSHVLAAGRGELAAKSATAARESAAKTPCASNLATASAGRPGKSLEDGNSNLHARAHGEPTQRASSQQRADDDDFWNYSAAHAGAAKTRSSGSAHSISAASSAAAGNSGWDQQAAMALLSGVELDGAVKLYVVEAAREAGAGQQTEDCLWECVGDMLVASGAGEEVLNLYMCIRACILKYMNEHPFTNTYLPGFLSWRNAFRPTHACGIQPSRTFWLSSSQLWLNGILLLEFTAFSFNCLCEASTKPTVQTHKISQPIMNTVFVLVVTQNTLAFPKQHPTS
jgi:hypothetical protein